MIQKILKIKEHRVEFLINTTELINTIYLIAKNTYQISKEELENERNRKNEERGSFKEKIYCNCILLKNDDQYLEYYQSKNTEYKPLHIIGHDTIKEGYKIFECNKLVRDKTIERSIKKNRIIIYKKMNNEDFLRELKSKLKEEYQELKNAKKKEEIIEEFTDLIEIILHLKDITKTQR